MGFHVGQKVVCVDDVVLARSATQLVQIDDPLTRGRMYMVRETGVLSPRDGETLYIRVEEIRERPLNHGDFPYHASRFRPVTERKTNISVFTRMLTDAPKELERVND